MDVLTLLTAARGAGLTVYLDGGRLRVKGKPSLRPHAEPLFQNRAEVTAALLAESDDWHSTSTTWTQVIERSTAPDVPPWPIEAAALAMTLTPGDLPSVPFEFGGRHCTVTDGARFLAALQADVQHGPAGPRAIYGTVQRELLRLADMVAATATGREQRTADAREHAA